MEWFADFGVRQGYTYILDLQKNFVKKMLVSLGLDIQDLLCFLSIFKSGFYLAFFLAGPLKLKNWQIIFFRSLFRAIYLFLGHIRGPTKHLGK